MGSRWLSRLAVAAAASATLTLMAGTAAWADTMIPLHQTENGKTITAAKASQDCSAPFDDVTGDQDGWHFVLPAGSGDEFTSLSLTFTKPGGATEAVKITSHDPVVPSTGAGWSGYVDHAGNSADDKHAFLFTEAGWTLAAGTAAVTGQPGNKPFFNLSHACAGGTTPSEEPSEEPSETPSSSAPAGGGSGGLPITGAAVGGVVVMGIGLVAAGVALMAIRRRRDIPDLTEI